MRTTFATCLFFLAALQGCAATATLIGSRSAPGARGKVKLAKGDNGNSQVRVLVEHLAAPDQVVNGARAYVVWVQNIDHVSPPQNIGELQVNDKLEGDLSTVTSMVTFDLTITPESSAQVVKPSNQPVLSARVDRND